MATTRNAAARAARVGLVAAGLWAGAAAAAGGEGEVAGGVRPEGVRVAAAVPLPPAPAGTSVIPASPASPVEAASPARRGYHVLGLALDAGVPNGAGATLLYRPWKYVRLGGSFLYNLAGYGVGGSVTVAPYFPIAPSLTLEAGHYFESDASAAVRRFTTVSSNVDNWLHQVGYTYVNAQVGLELGAQNWFVFYVRGGLSRVWASLHAASNDVSYGSSTTTVSYVADPRTVLTIPTVKAGLMFFFY